MNVNISSLVRFHSLLVLIHFFIMFVNCMYYLTSSFYGASCVKGTKNLLLNFSNLVNGNNFVFSCIVAVLICLMPRVVKSSTVLVLLSSLFFYCNWRIVVSCRTSVSSRVQQYQMNCRFELFVIFLSFVTNMTSSL